MLRKTSTPQSWPIKKAAMAESRLTVPPCRGPAKRYPQARADMTFHGKTVAEIFDCVRTLAHSGRLPAGASLPPVRELAATLGVNRNTVAAAYRRLVLAGLAQTQGRLGTLIRDARSAGEQEGAQADSPLIDLASGNPNPCWLPDPRAALPAYRPRLYGEATLNPGLRDYLQTWFSPDCPPDFEIDLAHGAVDAIERLLGAYLVAGDKVAVENPCFLSSINTLRTLGLQALSVPVDRQGMATSALQTALAKGARAVILTPRAHNPTACSMSESRAREVSRLLARHPDVLLIIDDHFALLSRSPYYSALPRRAGRWALVRSFSKALGPDLRMAAIASDPSTSAQLRLRLASGTNWVSHLLQDMAETALTHPESIRQLSAARADYQQRRQTFEAALRNQGISFLAHGDGLNLWVPLPAQDLDVAQDLARQGWLLRHGQAFSVQAPVQGLRITLSTLLPAQCEQLARDLHRSLAARGLLNEAS